MKKYFILLLFVIGTIIFPIPKYKELNHIVIVDSIYVLCNENGYKVKIKEINPVRRDDGLHYEYKYYIKSGKYLHDIKKIFDNDKSFYYDGTKHLITNCSYSDYIISVFSINPNDVLHNKKLDF